MSELCGGVWRALHRRALHRRAPGRRSRWAGRRTTLDASSLRIARAAAAQAGHAAFHHALTVHGSWGNRSALPRRALVLNFFAHGTRTNMDGTLMKGLPEVQAGEVLRGAFHPVVFDTTRLDMSELAVAGV